MLISFLGKLHPMMVHFPIGLLIMAAVMEFVALRQKREDLRAGIRWVVHFGTGSAVVSLVLGLLLQNTESYEGDLVNFHQRAAILTTILAAITSMWLWRHQRYQALRDLRMYRMFLVLTVIILTGTGHLGASLTHGEDYLSSVFSERSSGHSSAAIAEFTSLKSGATLSADQLNRLNLEVRAIFAHNCYQCHSKEKHKGELILQNQAGVMAGGESGPILIAGNAKESEIMRRLTLDRSEKESMPPKGKSLKSDEIDLIGLWIDQGAHWADTTLKIFREAPLALSSPQLPQSEGEMNNPIDRIVNAYFKKNKANWPEIVEGRIFLRRAYLDIIGLLPTPSQTEKFLNNKSPDKRQQLIDDLLKDDQNYAQHWLTFWNDLLRNDYSGTGFITGGRKKITPWLYEALTTNRSYNEMAKELLNPSPRSQGFIKGIRWRGVVNASQTPEMQAAQNISQSLLGMNLKCASCHDSFVSNLTLAQSYGFASIFADSTLEIHRCDKPTGRMARTAFIYPELGTVDAESIKERLEQLSTVMVQPQNGRLYRTFVNRIWAQLMGRGIVTPVDEMDRLPWDQDLLDWLAADFVEHKGDIKHVIRTIMTSRTYQLPSVGYENLNKVVGADFAFRGPIRRRLSAEQLADAISQSIHPMYPSVVFDPLGDTLEAEWIWHEEIEVDRRVLPKPGKRYFRYSFELPDNQKIETATLLVTADDNYELFINGKELITGDNWREPKQMSIKEQLISGKNQFAVMGENRGEIPNPAGLLLSLKLEDVSGKQWGIHSSQDWKSTDSLTNENWTQAEFDDSKWEKAHRYSRFFSGEWGRILAFTHIENGHPIPIARASLVPVDPFLGALGRPTRENVTTKRDDRATLLQALELTNGITFYETIMTGAKKWDSDIKDREKLIQEMYMRMLNRRPEQKEVKIASKLWDETDSLNGTQDFLWAMVMLPEFQLIY